MSELSTEIREQAKRYFCYIVRCNNDTFYTGWTTDPERRVKAHNAGRGAAYTKIHNPVELVYVEELDSRHAAMCRELQIKKLPREKKACLAAGWKE